MGILPMVHVLVHFGAAETAIAPARGARTPFAGAIALRLRRVRGYTHHGRDAHATSHRPQQIPSSARLPAVATIPRMSRLVIGILANSDGRSDAVAAAVDVFLASGAEVLIHCGDVGGRHVLDAMSGFGTSMFVWGDRDK